MKVPEVWSDHPYLGFLHEVQRPARYLGREVNSVVKESARYRMVLVFPDVYEVGMSHVGLRLLYYSVNSFPDLALERAFAPWLDMEGQLRRLRMPLVSLETWTPLHRFDIIGFSLTHELVFTNVLAVLDLAGIPLRAVERSDRHPVVLGGGACALHPEPISPFFDAFYLGEAERDLPRILRMVGSMREAGASRHAMWRALAEFPGVYCPPLYEARSTDPTGFLVPEPVDGDVPGKVSRRFLKDLTESPVPPRPIVPWTRPVFDRMSLEIARGCTEGCRFCEAGYTYRPTRDRPVEAIVSGSLCAIENSGIEELSLCSLSPADYPALGQLTKTLSELLKDRNVTLAVSSLRAYGVGEDVVKALLAHRATTLTLAPEAGSQRMRNVINKNVTHEDLMQAVDRALSAGWQKFKLYFMVGLPTETDEDAAAIACLVNDVARLLRKGNRLSVAIGQFVPRPHTPFQWDAFAPRKTVLDRIATVKREIRSRKVKLSINDPRLSWLECVLARGDRRVAGAIEKAYRAGARFDGWQDVFDEHRWTHALGRLPLELYTGESPEDARLPWDFVDVGVDKEFLLRERKKAYRARTTVPCLKPLKAPRPQATDYLKGHKLACVACGLDCDLETMAQRRRRLVQPGMGWVERAKKQAGHSPETTVFLWYTKMGPCAYLSHKDIVVEVPRVFRHAGYDLVYTRGFHPHPKITYRNPAPLGYQSVGEWLVVSLRLQEGEAIDTDRLSACAPPGMVFWKPVQAPQGVRSPSAEAYAFRLHHQLLDRLTSLEMPDGWRLDRLDGHPRFLEECLGIEDASSSLVYVLILEGPAGGRQKPKTRPHEWLSCITGKDVAPMEFVRLPPRPPAYESTTR